VPVTLIEPSENSTSADADSTFSLAISFNSSTSY
jgi:hypothetical protein